MFTRNWYGLLASAWGYTDTQKQIIHCQNISGQEISSSAYVPADFILSKTKLLKIAEFLGTNGAISQEGIVIGYNPELSGYNSENEPIGDPVPAKELFTTNSIEPNLDISITIETADFQINKSSLGERSDLTVSIPLKLKNNTSEVLRYNEIGIYAKINSDFVLIEHSLFDTVKTLAPQQTEDIKYELRFGVPTMGDEF